MDHYGTTLMQCGFLETFVVIVWLFDLCSSNGIHVSEFLRTQLGFELGPLISNLKPLSITPLTHQSLQPLVKRPPMGVLTRFEVT